MEQFSAFKREKKYIYNSSLTPSPVECAIKVLVILYEIFPLTPETENVGLLSFIVVPSDNKETRNILKQSPHKEAGTVNLTWGIDNFYFRHKEEKLNLN